MTPAERGVTAFWRAWGAATSLGVRDVTQSPGYAVGNFVGEGVGVLGSVVQVAEALNGIEDLAQLGVSEDTADALYEIAKAGENIPETGIERFDQLAIENENFAQWAKNLKARNFDIVMQTLKPGLHAFYDDIVAENGIITEGVMTIDPEQFTYLDMLHESRHLVQFETLAAEQGLTGFSDELGFQGLARTSKLNAWLERGAYEYELRLGNRVGFSQEYMDWAAKRLNSYWGRSNETKILRGGVSYLTDIWR